MAGNGHGRLDPQLSPARSHATRVASRKPAKVAEGRLEQRGVRSIRGEMIEIGGSFGVRFVFLQAQATRMVYAIATAGAEIEPNERRAEWLRRLAAEYEGYRDELVGIVEKYILQQGAAQKE